MIQIQLQLDTNTIWYKCKYKLIQIVCLGGARMRATSKQDLHDFPDLSPPMGAAQLLINAKDYANHSNHHCIMSFQIEKLSSGNTGFSLIKTS